MNKHIASIKRWRMQIFAITWLAYAAFYFTRKAFSVAKLGIGEDPSFTLDKMAMANLDAIYLTAYAIGQFTWGILADRFGPRVVVLGGGDTAMDVLRMAIRCGATDASAAGVTKAWVTCRLRSSSARSSPPYTDGGAMTMVEPAPTASSNSRTDASKLGDAKCRVREAGVSA